MLGYDSFKENGFTCASRITHHKLMRDVSYHVGVRTTLNLSEDAHQVLVAMSERSGLPLGAIVDNLIRESRRGYGAGGDSGGTGVLELSAVEEHAQTLKKKPAVNSKLGDKRSSAASGKAGTKAGLKGLTSGSSNLGSGGDYLASDEDAKILRVREARAAYPSVSGKQMGGDLAFGSLEADGVDGTRGGAPVVANRKQMMVFTPALIREILEESEF